MYKGKEDLSFINDQELISDYIENKINIKQVNKYIDQGITVYQDMDITETYNLALQIDQVIEKEIKKRNLVLTLDQLAIIQVR